jgi:hypothetical protein
MTDAIQIGGRLTLMQVAKAVNKLNGEVEAHVTDTKRSFADGEKRFTELTDLITKSTRATQTLNETMAPVAATVAGYEEVRRSGMRAISWLAAIAVTALVTVLVQNFVQHEQSTAQLTQIGVKATQAAQASQQAATASQKTARAVGAAP